MHALPHLAAGGEGKKSSETMDETNDQHLHSMCQIKIDQMLTAESHGDVVDLQELSAAVENLTALVEKEMMTEASNKNQAEVSHFEAIEKLSKLMNAVEASKLSASTRASAVLRCAMTLMEEEFRSLLEDKNDKLVNESSTSGKNEARVEERSDVVERLRKIASTMIAAGYATECSQVFSIARREKLTTSLMESGFMKVSVQDPHRIEWEELEVELAAWIAAFRHMVTVSLPEERLLCHAIFNDHPIISDGLFSNLTRGVVVQLLKFVEVATMTKKSGEKLFKFLDMYETMRDLISSIDEMFPVAVDKQQEEEAASFPSSLLQAELKSEMLVAKSKIGETVFEMFDLENSLKSESTKVAVPGGAVHPVTRYVVNYLKFVFEYTNSMEQVFQEHGSENMKDVENTGTAGSSSGGSDSTGSSDRTERQSSPFAAKLRTVIDLLDDTIDSKSRLYKDQSLRPVFLMNNARYILHKLKDCSEIKGLLGDYWYRKISIDIQKNHKAYRRDTWQKVLDCLREEGLHGKGNSSVSKPVLKERFKTFNALFEEIIKTQSVWIVNDEQLKSELRVSVQAVVVPAYRSFVGRYRQNLDPGRQTDKYIKYAAEDVETYIDDLFEGKPSLITRRK